MRTPSAAARPVEVSDAPYYDDDVLLSGDRAQTWASLPTVPYAFRSRADRRDLGWTSSLSLAQLRRGHLHLKVRHAATSGGGALGSWAAERDARARRYAEPAPGWAGHLAAAQARMLERQAWSKEVFLGVGLGTRGPLAQLRDRLPPDDAPVGPRELERWRRAADAARATLARGALAGEGLSASALRALRQATVFRGLEPPPPTVTGRRWWGPRETCDELLGCEVAPVVLATSRGARTVLRVTAPDGRVTHTAAWVMSAFPLRMSFPTAPPWLAHLDGLSFPAELDARLELVPPRRAAGHMRRRLDLARDQQRDAEFADADLPIETEQMLALARQWEYEIPTRRLPMVYGHVALRADAESAEDLAAMWEEATEHYAELSVDLAWPGGMSQADLLREALPGSAAAFRSYRQRWPVETVGCGLPTASSGLGHRAGVYAGVTTGRQVRVVTWDPHFAITREEGARGHVEAQGGTLLWGNQRAGKSGALLAVAHDATLAGTPTVLVDFGGQTAALARVPAVADRVGVIDLMTVGGGAADPLGRAVVPGDWREPAVRAERERLARDTYSTLAWALLAQDRDAGTELRGAIRRASGTDESSTRAFLAELRRTRRRAAVNLASFLEFELDSDGGELVSGEGGGGIEADRTLTVITGRGLALPRADAPLSAWSPGELFGAAVFGVVAHRARRLLWALPPGVLSLFVVDEAHVALATPAGQQVVSESLRSGPKYGVATLLATHNAADVERLGWLLGAVSTYMIFRSTDADDLTKQLRAASVEDTPQTRALIRGFRNGECLAVFPGDERDRFRWDQWDPELRRAQDTTAGRGGSRRVLEVA